MPSPTPTNLTGIPNSSTTLTTAPPRAVPSSLVKMMPVTPTASPKTRAWFNMFNPVVPSNTSNTSCGALGMRFVIAFFTPINSSIKAELLCNRPEVSAKTISMPPMAHASSTALKHTAPGFVFGGESDMIAPVRSAHVASCSAAAARNVSPGTIITFAPLSANR